MNKDKHIIPESNRDASEGKLSANFPGDNGTPVPGTEAKPFTVFNYGWICPICGRGNSPHTSSCPCRPAPPFTITCGVIT